MEHYEFVSNILNIESIYLYFRKDIILYGSFVPIFLLYILFVYLTPGIIISKICSKLIKTGEINYNEILHMPRSTDESRQVVIPCPDFVYSCICIDFQKPNEIILFKGLLKGKCEYASAGLYDRNGLCFDIYNHSNQDLQLVIVSPTNYMSEKQIISELYTKKLVTTGVNVSIVRMPTMQGVLLHRLLISNPETEAYEKCRNIQCKYISISHTVHFNISTFNIPPLYLIVSVSVARFSLCCFKVW